MKVLVAYATCHGSTRSVAERVAMRGRWFAAHAPVPRAVEVDSGYLAPPT